MPKKDKRKSKVISSKGKAKILKRQKAETHYTYILKCADETLYVGATNNLKRRLIQHNTSKRGAHYTKIRRPVALMYSETFKTLGESRKREAEIKRMPRSSKIRLFTVTV